VSTATTAPQSSSTPVLEPAETAALWQAVGAELAGIPGGLADLGADELVAAAAAVPRLLPRAVLQAVHRYRSGATGDDVLLVRGLLPADVDFGPTAASSTAPLAGEEVQRAALLLLGTVLLVGEPFNFRTLYGGKVVQHVVPVPTMEYTQTGESSGGTLDWHVEDGFSEDRCDHFALLCLNGAGAAATDYAAARDLRLPADVVEVLQQDRFEMWPDTAHVLETVTPTRTAVLSGPEHAPELCYDAHYLHPADPADSVALDALRQLREALDQVRRSRVLGRGDLLLLDNRRGVHARTPFTPRYDGTDRWLLRTMVCSSLLAFRRRGQRILD
jgi:L-asparagine oxygenase